LKYFDLQGTWRAPDNTIMRLPFRPVAALVAAVTLSHCTKAPAVRPPQPAVRAVTIPGEIRVNLRGRIVKVPFEDYVLAAALSEVSPVGESAATTDRIFEVQSVIARTYALAHVGRHGADGYDVCDGTHCQLYQPSRTATSRFTATARRALTRTRGDVLTFAGRPVDALFHSDCGGHTAASTTAWGGAPVPYLSGRDDDVPQATHRAWQFSVNNEALRNAVNSDGRSAVGSRLDALTVVERDESGRAVRVELRGERRQVLRAEQLRAIVTAKLGDRTIQSTRFTVKETGTRWEFSGTGFGHGVGLCQVGAAARARRGESLADILRTYYPGTKLVSS